MLALLWSGWLAAPWCPAAEPVGVALPEGRPVLSAETVLEHPSSRKLVAFNDFSYSPHNAIEATFSTDNFFYGNVCRDSGYGVWAGFSNRSSLIRNEIDGCLADGIAIEHGAGNVVADNLIANATKGVNFWKIPRSATPPTRSGRTPPATRGSSATNSGAAARPRQDRS